MRRVYGAVWDTQSPPLGAAAISFRVQLAGAAETKWVQLAGVVASNWKPGLTYDASIQLN